ncbi:MAG: hypothetical protein WD406_12785 [Pseudohongiellaceae bacterium]
MRIIVSDSFCLIDLKKGGLLRAIFELPFSFVMPQPLFDDELVSFTDREKRMMIDAGMEIVTLPGEQVLRAAAHFNQVRRLKMNDCFALVLAGNISASILFTGDAPMKVRAESLGIETHGILWAIDQLEALTGTPHWLLRDALMKFQDDPLVRLPEDEIRKRILRLSRRSRED